MNNNTDTAICSTCKQELLKSCFYQNRRSKSGYNSYCKSCGSIAQKKRLAHFRENPEWVKQERQRVRDSQRNRKRNPHTPEQRKRNYMRKKLIFPEKLSANFAARTLPRTIGFNNHHWSYRKEHRKDVIILTISQHHLVHRFMVYDQERMMYRRLDGTLIDSREAAIAYYATLADDSLTIKDTQKEISHA